MFVTDPLTGQARILAPGRAQRLGPRPQGCPFCVGNEAHTPPELDRIEVDGAWAARVVPNLFPLAPIHEVIILSSRHLTSTRELDAGEWQIVVELGLRRLAAHRGSGDYLHLFVNDGKGAGASLEHTHAQLVGIPRGEVSDRLLGGVSDPATCAACTLVATLDDGLIVWSKGELVLVAAPAPRSGESLLLVPRSHHTDPAALASELAAALQVAVGALPDADFNLWLVTDATAHWYVEFLPRGSNLAGVELGLGVGVSIVDPADAAQRARDRLNTL